MNPLEKWRAANGGYDYLGRRQPRQLGIPDYLLMIARIEPARVRRVPMSAIAEDGYDDDGLYTLLSCPCGHKPVVRERLEQCADCDRYYVTVALGSAWVTYGAMSPPPLSTSASRPVTCLS